jgi:glycosyltransferase involved in cell wall biosynthesis
MADVFVLPTLYEGFTLVTLEAMAYGTPVVATDTSSIREGVGDAALLVPVDDVDALARALWSVVGDAHVRWQLIERGKIQAQKFGWERCAQETLAVYRELYEKARLNPLKRPGGTLTQCVPA